MGGVVHITSVDSNKWMSFVDNSSYNTGLALHEVQAETGNISALVVRPEDRNSPIGCELQQMNLERGSNMRGNRSTASRNGRINNNHTFLVKGIRVEASHTAEICG